MESIIEQARKSEPKPDENNVKTFGLKEEPKQPKPTPEPEKDVHKQPENKQDKPKEDSPESKKNPEPQAPENKKEQPKPSPSPDDDNKEKLKVSFNKQDNSDKKPSPTPDDQPKEKAIESKDVLAFLNENYPDLKINDLKSLSVKQELPEAVQKFFDYNKETGRGLKDFYNLQRDWNKEDKDSVISEYYKLKYPHMNPEDVDAEIDLIRVTQEDEDDLGERELKQRKSNYNKVYNEALSFMLSKSDEYATKLEGSPQQKQLTADEIAELHKPYWNKRDASLNNLKDFSLDIDGIGEIKVPIDAEMKSILSSNTQTLEDMISQWQNEDKSINTDKMLPDFLWAHEPTREKLLQGILEQFHVLSLDKQSKKQRRVDLDKDKPSPTPEKEESNAFMQVSSSGDTSADTRQMGQPLLK